MRVRNPNTGTVVGVGDETGKRLLAAGWSNADSSNPGAGSTKSTSDANEPTSKTRRRRTSR